MHATNHLPSIGIVIAMVSMVLRSSLMTPVAPGPYHCSIHPVMVGTIVGN